MQDNPDMFIKVLLSIFFGGSSASLVSVRREVTIGQTVTAALTACIVSATAPFILMAVDWHWAWAIPLSALAGFLVYGFMAWVDVNEKRVPTIDWTQVLPKSGNTGKNQQQGAQGDNTQPKEPNDVR